MARRGLTAREREERRARERERLKRAAEELLSSQGWQRWVRVRARNGLSRYSMSNQLLIAMSCPEASFVAGFKAWLELGYCVRKGERAIRILAPLPVKQRDRANGEETGETITLFKTVFVFDRAQVSPIPGREHAPLKPPSEPLTGDSHAHLIEPLSAFCETLGYAVSFEAIGGGAGGFCDRKAKRIVVATSLPANAKLRALIPWRKQRIPTFGM